VSLLVNFESPAQCRGIVSSWRYCYYRPSGDYNDDDIFGAKLMIYRQNPSHINKYNLVSQSVTDLRLEWSAIKNSSFQCVDEVLQKSDQFEVRDNDIVGACITNRWWYKNDRWWHIHPLPLVGTSEESSLLTDVRSYQQCGPLLVGQIHTHNRNFIRLSGIILHVYATIGELKFKFQVNEVC